MKIKETDKPDRNGVYPCCWISGRDATPQKIYEWLFYHFQGYKFAVMFDCTKDEFEDMDKETPVYFADGILDEVLDYVGIDAVKKWLNEHS